MPDSLFDRFENVLVFDIETTGLDPKYDEIIEIGMLCATRKNEEFVVSDTLSILVKLSDNRILPREITDLTGITSKTLETEGLSKQDACEALLKMLRKPNALIAAYNAQFDLQFIYYFLNSFQKAGVLRDIKMLDVLTVYKDRRPYPHKLSDAAATYSVDPEGAHRAFDDTKMTYEVLCKMIEEDDDLINYVNLFGYNPKYGVSGQKISSINYVPQAYDAKNKLYEGNNY